MHGHLKVKLIFLFKPTSIRLGKLLHKEGRGVDM